MVIDEATGWRIANQTQLPLACFTRVGLAQTSFLAAMHERQIAWMPEAARREEPVCGRGLPLSEPRKPILNGW